VTAPAINFAALPIPCAKHALERRMDLSARRSRAAVQKSVKFAAVIETGVGNGIRACADRTA